MNVTNAQGINAHLVAVGTDVSDAAAIKTAIATGKQINCLIEVGDIALGTKSVTEYACMSSNETFKALGTISLANITPQLLFDATDTAGQQDLKAMWDADERRIMIILFNDEITPTTGNKTSLTFEAAISAPTIGIAKDGAIMYNPTIEICTKPNLIEAT